MNTNDQTALVTGSSSGIGQEFARQLHRRGYRVILVARRADRLVNLADEFNAVRPNSAEVLVADLAIQGSSDGGLDKVCKYVQDHRIDVLVNNAGRGSFGYFEALPLSGEQEMIALNITASSSLFHAVIPQMKSRRSGKLVSVASVAAFQPLPYMATYAATKAFNFVHTMALREELRSFGISVLTVCPGPTATEFGGVARVPGTLTGMNRDSVEEVVGQALGALDRNKPFIVPCFRSWLMAMGSRVAHVSLTTRIVERVLGRVLPK